MTTTAKLFTIGRSQALRLPEEFRFEGTAMLIRRDPKSGDVILSRRPTNWDGLFALYDKSVVPDDFLGEAERETAMDTNPTGDRKSPPPKPSLG